MLSKKTFFFILFVIYSSLPAYSQQILSMKIGTAYEYSKDQVISESIFEGYETLLVSAFQIDHLNSVHFSFQFGELYSRNNHRWKTFSPSLSYERVLKEHHSPNFEHTFSLGLHLDGKWIDPSFKLLSSYMDGRKSGYFNSNIAISYSPELRIRKKNFLQLNLKVPILSYVLRPGYSILDPDETIGNDATFWNVAKSGRLESLFSQPSFSSSFGIKGEVSSKIGYELLYSYNFLKIESQKEFSGLNKHLTIGVIWKL